MLDGFVVFGVGVGKIACELLSSLGAMLFCFSF